MEAGVAADFACLLEAAVEDPLEDEVFYHLETHSHFEFDSVGFVDTIAIPWAANFLANNDCFNLECVTVQDIRQPAANVSDMHPWTHPEVQVLLVVVRALWLEHVRILWHVVVVQ